MQKHHPRTLKECVNRALARLGGLRKQRSLAEGLNSVVARKRYAEYYSRQQDKILLQFKRDKARLK
jgi:hypothetical protein